MVCGNIFKALSIPNRKSQRAEILRECSSHTMCHLSHVKIFSFFHLKKILKKKIGKSGGASRRRVCYQRGLPQLVYRLIQKFQNHIQRVTICQNIQQVKLTLSYVLKPCLMPQQIKICSDLGYLSLHSQLAKSIPLNRLEHIIFLNR